MSEITQADREAAANLYLDLEGLPYSPRDLAVADEHRRGECDEHASVQAFARHRIEAAAQARREAIEEAAAKADSIGEAYGEDETGWFECSETIARAIRSLSPESKGD